MLGYKFPTICPILCYVKKTKQKFADRNKLLATLTPFMNQLAKGIDFYGLKIFGVTTAILGDLPGRCEFSTID